MADVDFETVEARFRALAAEWRLSTMEASLLLGIDGAALGLDLVPRRPATDVRHKMRLLVRLREALSAIFPSTRETARWLRTFDGDDLSPIVFMSHGRDRIAAMIEAVQASAARNPIN
jgi:hypothetical protein